MNVVGLVGRMTKDVELRKTNKGDSVASFTLAVNRNYNSADGQQADFIPCQVWGKVADNTSKYCAKGSQVAVTGALRSRSYDNAQGQKVFVVEVVASSVEFLNHKKEEKPQANTNDFFNAPTNNNTFDSFDVMEDELGDIQF